MDANTNYIDDKFIEKLLESVQGKMSTESFQILLSALYNASDEDGKKQLAIITGISPEKLHQD